MRWLVYVLIGIAAFSLGWCGRGGGRRTQTDTVTRTVTHTSVKVDTLVIVRPLPYACYVTRDSIVFDSCTHAKETAEYRDSTYRAWVSGVSPRLDSIEVYPRTIYRREYVYRDVIKREKRKRFGIGLSAGYGFSRDGFSPFVGVGVSYNLWNF